MCFGRQTFWDWRIFGRDRNFFLNQNREGNSFFFEIQLKNHTSSILAHDSCAFHAVFSLAYFVYSTFESVCMSTKGNGVSLNSYDRNHFRSNKTHKKHKNKKTTVLFDMFLYQCLTFSNKIRAEPKNAFAWGGQFLGHSLWLETEKLAISRNSL